MGDRKKNKSMLVFAITVAILLTVGLPSVRLAAKEFRGRVTDEFDQPIYGALVAVHPAGVEEGNADSLPKPVLTDGQGMFTVELPNDPSSPHVTIWALADGYNLATVLANTNVADTQIHLTASSTIRCSVALPHYEPAAGVRLQVHRFQFERTVAVVPSVFRLRLEQKTDADGNAVLRQLSLSNVRSLIAKSESYGDQILRIEEYIDPSKPQLLFLAPAATLKVFVDSKHPQNLLGRRGTVRSEAGNGASTEHEFALDAEGSFFLPNIVEGKASLTWKDWPSMALELSCL